jgi:hypothetical protein
VRFLEGAKQDGTVRRALDAAGFKDVPVAAKAIAPCAPRDVDCMLPIVRAHPIRQLGFWREALAKPVEQRVGPSPAALVEYLLLDNYTNGFPEVPRVAAPSAAFMADVRSAIAELPASVKRALGPNFAGLYFVEDLGGTGFSDAIEDGPRIAAAYIVLDAAVLEQRVANVWATWKESSPFKVDPAWALRARIEEPSADNRRNAIQYILLHELGHVVSLGRTDVHPYWGLPLKDIPADARYPYFDLTWTIDRAAGKYVSRFDERFPQRKDVVFYLGAKLPGEAMVPVYEALEATNFPTLYAATHPGDDFAEAFANYIHVVLLKRPFAIELAKDGQVVKRYKACWDEERCAAKRRFLENVLK